VTAHMSYFVLCHMICFRQSLPTWFVSSICCSHNFSVAHVIFLLHCPHDHSTRWVTPNCPDIHRSIRVMVSLKLWKLQQEPRLSIRLPSPLTGPEAPSQWRQGLADAGRRGQRAAESGDDRFRVRGNDGQSEHQPPLLHRQSER
jgi:hypothetical protein